MEMIYLRWLDSATRDGWQEVPEEGIGLSEIQSIGYLLFEDQLSIEIVQSHFLECKQCSAILSIPKSVVLERKMLTVIE